MINQKINDGKRKLERLPSLSVFPYDSQHETDCQKAVMLMTDLLQHVHNFLALAANLIPDMCQ